MIDSFRTRLLNRIRAIIRTRGLDAFLVTCPENRLYISGFSAEDPGLNESAGALLITLQEHMVLTDGRYIGSAQMEAPGWAVKVYKKGLPNILKSLSRQISLKRIGYEASFITCQRFHELEKALPNTEFLALDGRIERIRACKAPSEYTLIKKAIQAAEDIFDGIWRGIEAGMTEKQVALQILEGLWERSDGPSFPPIVASGPNAALPHAVPTDRRIKEGEPIIVDMGARVSGYCSDMTRTIFLGTPMEPFKEIYSVVKRAQARAQRALKAGMTGREADQVARKTIKAAGYGAEFVHGLGHGVGLAVHEAPTLSPRARKRLKPGNVVTVEPGIYLPELGGVRLENMVLITESGAEVINSQKWYYDY